LDAPPQAVINRKPEHTLEEASDYCGLYRELAIKLDVPTIWALNPPDHVEQEIINRLEGHIA